MRVRFVTWNHPKLENSPAPARHLSPPMQLYLTRLARSRILQRASNRLTRRSCSWNRNSRRSRSRRHRNLRNLRRRPRPQVVRRLQPLLPRIHVHRRQLPDVRALQKQIQRLALIDERPALRRHIDQRPHRNLPRRPIHSRESPPESRQSPESSLPPSSAGSASLRSTNPARFNSVTRYRFICKKSPDSVSRLNKFEICGSMHSQQPAIDAIVAVGAIAISRELRNPTDLHPRPQILPSQRISGRTSRPTHRTATSPSAARVSANAGCAPNTPPPARTTRSARENKSLPECAQKARAPPANRTAAATERTHPAAPSARAQPAATS